MPKTTVIHVNDADLSDPEVVYIGRAVGRKRLKASPWGNTFKVQGEQFRYEAVVRFNRWVRTSHDPRAVWMREHVHELRGKKLACWCHPKACHGDVLAEMADAEPPR